MFPRSTFNDLLYPMTADIYYATESQNDFGEVIKEWDKDRTIKCSAIKQNPDSKVGKILDSEKYIEYDLSVNFRTNNDVQNSSNNIIYNVTDILVTNIRDSKRNLIWKESEDTGTIFEIKTVEPMFDMFSVVNGYRISLVRADSQDI